MSSPLLTRDQLLTRLCEVFRRYGYEGSSMARIAKASGLGKASLYHYFPEGKVQMAHAVLDFVRKWFDEHVFAPLESVHPPHQRIVAMLDSLTDYYEKGQCACLPALFALTAERQLFAEQIQDFHARWLNALSQTLTDSGLARDIARRRAHDGLERIQGALVLARGMGDDKLFAAMAKELPEQLLAGAARSTLWTTRAPRLPATPAISRVG
jgi:TetR/AcrR family transcriptional repressor of lmrAB and yxaGH operons